MDEAGIPLSETEQKNLFPTQIEDLKLFLQVAQQEANLCSFGVFGASSGGNLTLELGNSEGLPMVSWSGLVDFEHFMSENNDAFET